jgi:hypothetical protein
MRARLSIALAAVGAVAACQQPPALRATPDHGPIDATRVDAALPADLAPDHSAVDAPAEVCVDLSPDTAPPALNHLISTGQSLATGVGGAPALSSTQPFANLMFNTGVQAGSLGLTGLVPLVEQGQETISSALANLVTERERAKGGDHALLVSCHAVGGASYGDLKQGTAPYAEGLAQTKAAASIAATLGLTHVVRAVTVVHGEADHAAGNTGYAKDLAQWQADYESDVTALTGQSGAVPLLQSQLSSWTAYGSETSLIPGAQLQATLSSGGRIVLVGPKYALPYIDGVHLTNKGYRWLGELYGKVYQRVVLQGQPWSPLMPNKITRTGVEIRVSFVVPVPPLVLDTTLVKDPGNSGFSYVDDGPSAPTIASVALDGGSAVKITLSHLPGGKDRRLRYAFSGTKHAPAGPSTGPRGNLRDSDATPSRHGHPLYNWAVHFEVAVP